MVLHDARTPGTEAYIRIYNTDGSEAEACGNGMRCVGWQVAQVTGRKALYAVSGSSFGIVGMPDDEARDLLDELAAHATHPKYQLRFKYGVGDVVVWDNAALLHSATLIDPNDARTLWRITVLESASDAAALDVLRATHGVM